MFRLERKRVKQGQAGISGCGLPTGVMDAGQRRGQSGGKAMYRAANSQHGWKRRLFRHALVGLMALIIGGVAPGHTASGTKAFAGNATTVFPVYINGCTAAFKSAADSASCAWADFRAAIEGVHTDQVIG